MNTTTEHLTWPPIELAQKVAAVKLAAQPFREPGARGRVILSRYGVSVTRFCQVLLALCADEDVVRAAPIEVRSIMSRLPSPEQRAARAAARRKVRTREW